MKSYSNNEIIEAFLNNKTYVIEKVYNELLPIVKKVALDYDCNYANHKDIMNEAMLVVFDKIRKNEFNINCSFSTYFYSVCRNLYIQETRKMKFKHEEFNENYNYNDDELMKEIEILEYKRKSLYLKYFFALSEKCREIIHLSLQKISLIEIAQELNISTEKYVKKLKYKCKSILINNIIKDRQYKELLNTDNELIESRR